YTRKGDQGNTSLIYGKRVPKDDLRVEAYGTCDELNSVIGLALSFLKDADFSGKDEFNEQMHRIQTILFHVGAELSTPAGKEVKWKLHEDHIKALEGWIDTWEQDLETLRNFILPSGHPASSTFHM